MKPILGQLIDGTTPLPYKRDAIHIAVVACIANEPLKPGDLIGIDLAECLANKVFDDLEADGVVDPFLPHNVKPFEMFFALVKPNRVAGLHHRWNFVEKAPKITLGSVESLRDYDNRCNVKPPDPENDGNETKETTEPGEILLDNGCRGCNS